MSQIDHSKFVVLDPDTFWIESLDKEEGVSLVVSPFEGDNTGVRYGIQFTFIAERSRPDACAKVEEMLQRLFKYLQPHLEAIKDEMDRLELEESNSKVRVRQYG